MPDTSDINIYVEFDDAERFVDIARDFNDTHTERAKEAIENSLQVIQWMADKTKCVLDAAHDKPNMAEVEFGIKVTSKAGILVAQAEADFHIKVKLVWTDSKST
jgi:hypothetical protein